MFHRNEIRNEGTFGCSTGTKKPERGYIRMFPRNENRNEGTFAKTTLLRNRPFLSPSDLRVATNFLGHFLLVPSIEKGVASHPGPEKDFLLASKKSKERKIREVPVALLHSIVTATMSQAHLRGLLCFCEHGTLSASLVYWDTLLSQYLRSGQDLCL